MLTLFWLALVLGGGLALFSVLGDFFESGGVDDVHLEHDAVDAHWQLLSLRTATYFLFAFGAVGVLVHSVAGGSGFIALAAALFTGIVAAVASASLFGYLRQSNSGEMEGDASYEGLPARVVLPLRGGRGKIMVTRGGRDLELMAECFDDDPLQPETWKDVVIVEIRGGTALVSPMHEFERTDALLPPVTE
jgi:hypothetical protein